MSPSAIAPPTEDTYSGEQSSYSKTYGTYCPPHMLSNLTKPIDRDEYKAYRQTMPNNFRGMMNSGSIVLGVGCNIPSVDSARVVATLPHHFCWLDTEHTPFDYLTLSHIITTINHVSQGRMGCVVRVPQSSPDLVAYCLNAGAAGIIFPHVQNAQQAKNLVDLCRFPPHGKRGYPPYSLFGYEKETGIPGKNVYDIWDESVCVIAQIEDPEGVKNVEEICAVEGVDALMVGTHDLRLELGIRPPGQFDGDEPEFLDALEKITRAAEKKGPHGMAILGLSRLGPDLAKRIHRGWRAFKITTDALLIHTQGHEHFEKAQILAEHTTQDDGASYESAAKVDPAKKANILAGIAANKVMF